MTAKVTTAEFDSSPSLGPTMTLLVVRVHPHYVPSEVPPLAEDFPRDVLEALRDWADSGIPKDGDSSEGGLSGTLVMSQDETYEDDDRCTASSWRGNLMTRRVKNPLYHHLYGPGGFNRCIKENTDGVRHGGLHEDEWGNRFELNPDTGYFRVRSQITHPFGTEE